MPRNHGINHFFSTALTIALLMGCAFYNPSLLHGGGGAENLVLVVNAESWASNTIANEYIALRDIPENRIIYLSNLSSFETIDVNEFREKILKPVIGTIQQRGLGRETDYIIYSSDLPTAINVKADTGNAKLPRMITPVASINGLTFLYQQVLARNPDYLRLDSNRYIRLPIENRNITPPSAEDQKQFATVQELLQNKKWADAAEILKLLTKKYPDRPDAPYNLACCYARMDKPEQAVKQLKLAIKSGWRNANHTAKDEDLKSLRDNAEFKQMLAKMKKLDNAIVEVQPAQAFRSRYQWDLAGTKVSEGGRGYLLSTMLGVTSGRGNSVSEALTSLRKSVQADHSAPQGTIYFVKNSNVRSTTRERLFASAVASLKKLGVNAEVVEGILPKQKKDVAGALIGTASFNWKQSNSEIQPGAICEHLTSFGGVMRENASQTPLTEFLRYGAAGSSGTVTEPFAIQAKFPLAFLHTHYAQGCSLAESFYQSVRGPYQLLIVGDPLCQPWAKAPQFEVKGLETDQEVKGTISLQPKASSTEVKIREFRLYLDGRRIDTCRPGEKFAIATQGMPDGWHEARVIAVADNPIETQSRTNIPFRINNRGEEVLLSSPAGKECKWNEKLKLKAIAEGAEVITFLHNMRPFERIQGGDGIIEFDPKRLGCGPVTIRAVALIQKRPVFSNSLTITILPPEPLPAKNPKAESWTDGLLFTNQDQKPVIISESKDREWLNKLLKKSKGDFELAGYVQTVKDLYQFQFRGDAIEEILVDEKAIWKRQDNANSTARWQFVPVALAEGKHHIVLRGRTRPTSQLEIRFGNRGAQRLMPKPFQHPTIDKTESKSAE